IGARGRVRSCQEKVMGLRPDEQAACPCVRRSANRSIDRSRLAASRRRIPGPARARQRMRSAASDIGGDLTLPKLPAPTIRVAQSRVKSKEENVMNVLAIGRYASRAFDAYVPPR